MEYFVFLGRKEFWTKVCQTLIDYCGGTTDLSTHLVRYHVKSSQVKFICIAHFMYKTIQSALQK